MVARGYHGAALKSTNGPSIAGGRVHAMVGAGRA
jgi:hypothetical protein